jgi:hypothetical protein|tara:strand:+ start:1452 stop:1727 length:276 start_codon:yes stop_codon:yes gene_type:complete
MDDRKLKDVFEIGNSYRVKPRDDVYPILDSEGNDTGKEEIVVSPRQEFKVLGFPADRPGFVEVQRPGRRKTNLYYMARTESMELIPTGDFL